MFHFNYWVRKKEYDFIDVPYLMLSCTKCGESHTVRKPEVKLIESFLGGK